MVRSKVKPRSHHDVADLQPPTNVPTMYELPTPYGCPDIDRTIYYRSRSLQKSHRSNQDHNMTLHTYNHQPMSLHLTVSEI